MALALLVVPQRRLKTKIQVQVVFLGREGKGVRRKCREGRAGNKG